MFRLHPWIGALCSLVFSQATLNAGTVDDALAAEAKLDTPRALELFLAAERSEPANAFILQKISRQYSDLVDEQTSDSEKRRFAQLALGYAQRAVELKPQDPVNVVSLAICHGKLALHSDTRAKVVYSHLIKEEAERAITMDPRYAWAHHVLGRWHYEVAEFGSASRWFAKLLYGGLPEASVAKAIHHLERAVELDPGELNHILELGFAYAANRRLDAARAAWQRGLQMPSRARQDESAKRRASAALVAAANKR